jgi:hypothetical protein
MTIQTFKVTNVLTRNTSRGRVIVVLLILYLTYTAFNNFRSQHYSSESEAPHDDVLESYSTSNILQQKSTEPIIPLYSRTDYFGLPKTIEFDGVTIFNPTLLALPYPGEERNASFVALAREDIRTKVAKINDIWVHPTAIFAGLLHFESDPERRTAPRDYPMVHSHFIERLDTLVHSEDIYFPKCEPDLAGLLKGNQGPEDPRLSWSHLGEPLVIYNSVSAENSEHCRQFYIADLRTVYPAVADILSDTVNPPPIRFEESVPIAYNGLAGFHKNWALFTNVDGDIFVHTHLAPQTIYKLNIDSFIPTFSSPPSQLVALEPIIQHPQEDENCITIALNSFKKRQFHQSSPFLDVVLCSSADVRSGLCDPDDPKNRLYMGAFHIQHVIRGAAWYEPRIVTLNSSFPFNYVSISKPLLYCTTLPIPESGVFANSAVSIPTTDLTYTVSLTFRKTQTVFSAQELARGYLDDMLIISFGWADKSSHFIEMEVADVLQGHYVCEDLINEYTAGDRPVMEES